MRHRVHSCMSHCFCTLLPHTNSPNSLSILSAFHTGDSARIGKESAAYFRLGEWRILPRQLFIIINVKHHCTIQQDTKKLAVHFPAPLAATQTRDIIKYLRSRRSTIRVGLLVLPVTPYQKQLWLGWAASFAESGKGDASLELWADRCLNNNQFHPKDIDKELFDHFEISPPKMRLDTAICISNQRFENGVGDLLSKREP